MRTLTNGIKVPDGNDNANRAYFEEQFTFIDHALGKTENMLQPTGTGNGIVLSVPNGASYKAYQKYAFVAMANNSGAATTIKVNGLAALPLFKQGTTTAPNLIAGKAYEVWVGANGDCFFLKASAEGTATKAQVLAGAPFSNESDTGLIGEMPNNGAVTITPSGVDKAIAAGYHNGSGKVSGVSVPAASVLSGTTIAGTTGTMVNRGAVTITPSGSTQTISQGYHNGSGVVSAVTVPVADVKAGTVIAGQTGTMVQHTTTQNRITAANAISADGSGHVFYLTPQAGYWSGSDAWVSYTDANFSPTNILSGITMLGLAGTAIPISAYPHGIQSYTIAGTYTFSVPANVTKITAVLIGGGGGGCGYGYSYSGGGGSGGYGGVSIVVTPGQVLTISVGTGGDKGTAYYSNGQGWAAPGKGVTGGTTYISGYATATGGEGGRCDSSNALYAYGGAGGTFSVANGTNLFASYASPSGNMPVANNIYEAYGGNSLFGYGGGGQGARSGGTSGAVILTW